MSDRWLRGNIRDAFEPNEDSPFTLGDMVESQCAACGRISGNESGLCDECDFLGAHISVVGPRKIARILGKPDLSMGLPFLCPGCGCLPCKCKGAADAS